VANEGTHNEVTGGGMFNGTVVQAGTVHVGIQVNEPPRGISTLSHGRALKVLNGEPLDRAISMLTHVDPGFAASVLELMSDEQTVEILGRMNPDSATAILNQLPESIGDPLHEILEAAAEIARCGAAWRDLVGEESGNLR
jgi:hypothetical protein